MERYRFTISDGDSFEHVGEAPYASPLAAEAHAIQVARELAEDDTWHGGWISVEDIRGNEIAKVSIGIERPLTKSEAEFPASDPKIEHVDPPPRRDSDD